MVKNQDKYDFWIKCISSIIFIIVLYLPHEMYITRFIGMIIFTVLFWRKQIKDLWFKHKENKGIKRWHEEYKRYYCNIEFKKAGDGTGEV